MKLLLDTSLDQPTWDASLLAHPNSHFLQSWAWGEFQISLQHPTWRVAVEDGGTIIAQLLIIKLGLGFGQSILYSPRGDFINPGSSAGAISDAANLLIKFIRELATKERALFFRIDPAINSTNVGAKTFYAALGFVGNTHKSIQPVTNQIIDLSAGLSTILQTAKPKARYNISLASKKELTISTEITDATIKDFINLTHKTAHRQAFKSHGDSYYTKQLLALKRFGLANLLIAYAPDNHPAAGVLTVTFGSTTTYVHGASDEQYKTLMAPYLLHYQAIKMATERGIRYYDLGGIALDPAHHWAGITRFKMGFGGESVSYLGSLELPVNKLLYKLYRASDTLR